MKGIAVDFPFFRFRYVKVQDDSQKQVKAQSKVKTPSLEKVEDSSPRAIKVEYTRPAEVTTLGIDPLVSSASVIHELVYGRIESSSVGTKPEASYPVSKEYISPSLDLIV